MWPTNVFVLDLTLVPKRILITGVSDLCKRPEGGRDYRLEFILCSLFGSRLLNMNV
jgi:hypothetical protein